MHRPCFLVVDQEFPGSISSRKLVIETAKYNVITAYSREEALATLRRFPKVDGVVLGTGMGRDVSRKLIEEFKELDGDMPLILTAADASEEGHGTDHVVPSFNPAKLLEKLQQLCGHSGDSLRHHESKLGNENG